MLSAVWKNIKDPLISYLQDLKTNRIHRERDGVIDTRKRLVSDLYKKYLSTQPFTAILPSSAMSNDSATNDLNNILASFPGIPHFQ